MQGFLLFLSGAVKLSLAPAAAVAWKKRTDARFWPFVVGFLACMAAGLLRGLLRGILRFGDPGTELLFRILLTAVIEETARLLVFRYALQNYDTPQEAAVCGLGHAMLENAGAALTTWGFIGTERAAEMSLVLDNLFLGGLAQACNTCFHAAMAVIVFTAVQQGREKTLLPAAMAVHFVVVLILECCPLAAEPVLNPLLTAACCLLAWKLKIAARGQRSEARGKSL